MSAGQKLQFAPAAYLRQTDGNINCHVYTTNIQNLVVCTCSL